MTRTRIKICGITSIEAAKAAVDAGADAIGLVFAEGSPRRVTIDLAASIVETLPPFVTPVGVFQLKGGVNPDLEHWKNIAHVVQLHGDESEVVARQVARTLGVIKGLPFEKSQVRRWDGCPFVQMLVIDGAIPGGGRGFRHDALAAMAPELKKPFMLAGGLTPENVADAIRAVRPYGVDVSTGVESSPGVKDPALIRAFCTAVREADIAAT